MSGFTVHTIESAPQKSKPLLETSKKSLGFVPNLYGVFAESPETLEAYQQVSALFAATSLSKVEQNVVWLTINVENQCHYCVPAHSVIAKSQGVDGKTVDALRNGEALEDQKLEALRQFTLKVVRQRGQVSEADTQTFLAAGYTRRNILDVILGVAQKTLSNYTNHFADTPVDEAFAGEAWTPVSANAA